MNVQLRSITAVRKCTWLLSAPPHPTTPHRRSLSLAPRVYIYTHTLLKIKHRTELGEPNLVVPKDQRRLKPTSPEIFRPESLRNLISTAWNTVYRWSPWQLKSPMDVDMDGVGLKIGYPMKHLVVQKMIQLPSLLNKLVYPYFLFKPGGVLEKLWLWEVQSFDWVILDDWYDTVIADILESILHRSVFTDNNHSEPQPKQSAPQYLSPWHTLNTFLGDVTWLVYSHFPFP